MNRRNVHSLVLFLLASGLMLTSVVPATAKKKDEKQHVAPTNLVWPLPPDKPRIKYIETLSNNLDVEPTKKRTWVDKMVGNGDPNVIEYFERPAGVATDSKGRILIASSQRATVYILEKEKHTVTRIQGERGLVLRTPLGLVVDSKDNFYVADAQLQSVLKFDPDGHLMATIGTDTGMKNPTFLALDEKRDRLLVVDSKLHQVLIYNPETLALTGKIGKRGEKPGEFNYPVGVAVAPDGSIAVTDTGSCSVEIFSADLKFARRIGRQGSRPGEFVRPKGVAYDNEGHLWVVDAAFNNFQIFTAEGKLLMFVGAYGSGPGQFSVPMDIFIDKTNRVYVSDSLNHRVQVFQFLGGN